MVKLVKLAKGGTVVSVHLPPAVPVPNRSAVNDTANCAIFPIIQSAYFKPKLN
jgi:hypothetical protein